MIDSKYALFLDTNALLNLGEQALTEHFIIAQKTLEELENIKSSGTKDGEIKFKARRIAHLLDIHDGDYDVIPFTPDINETLYAFDLPETPDNIILASVYDYSRSTNIPVIVCTDDLNCKFISRKIFGLKTKGIYELNLTANLDEYTGFKEVTLSDEEMSYFYLHLNENIYDSKVNEYIIIHKFDGEIVDYRKWDGNSYSPISYKQINNKFMGKVKPRNPHQVIAFDMLQDKDETIKVISGKFGSGKDFIMIANALKLIDEGKFDKLLYIRNAVGVKDASEIGFLPGDKMEKLLPYAMPLADHLGGQTGLEMKMLEGTIEIEHLGFIRGRDIKNTIIYVSEAENLTKEHVQLLIGRVGEGSALWMNGDFKQTDSALFRMNSGLLSTVHKLVGHEKFGYVQLQKTERSETAAMADLLD